MKNRTYKCHNRTIKEISPGIWQCRILAKRYHPEIPPFNTNTRDGAFNWLHGGSTVNITPGYTRPKGGSAQHVCRHRKENRPDRMEKLERLKQRFEKKKVRCIALGIPLYPPGIYKKAGGEEAAKTWFAGLDDDTKARILGRVPDGECRRGRHLVIAAFQQWLVCERDGTLPKFMSHLPVP